MIATREQLDRLLIEIDKIIVDIEYGIPLYDSTKMLKVRSLIRQHLGLDGNEAVEQPSTEVQP